MRIVHNTHRVGCVTIFFPGFSSSLRILMRYCVILVKRCLFLCTRNLGQCASCLSTCCKAVMYFLPAGGGRRRAGQCLKALLGGRALNAVESVSYNVLKRIFCHSFLGVCALSIVLMYRYTRPLSSRIVA
jgi:hypothetical protein